MSDLGDTITGSMPPPSCDGRVRRLFDYWRSIHPGGGGLPGRQHVEPMDLAEILRWLWLVDVQREPLRFRYRLIGTAHVKAMGRDITGLWTDEAFGGFHEKAGYAFRAVAGGEVRYCRRVPEFPIGREYAHIESLLLPLARDGLTVDMMLGIAVYRDSDGLAL